MAPEVLAVWPGGELVSANAGLGISVARKENSNTQAAKERNKEKSFFIGVLLFLAGLDCW
jgi:hypothetical protein